MSHFDTGGSGRKIPRAELGLTDLAECLVQVKPTAIIIGFRLHGGPQMNCGGTSQVERFVAEPVGFGGVFIVSADERATREDDLDVALLDEGVAMIRGACTTLAEPHGLAQLGVASESLPSSSSELPMLCELRIISPSQSSVPVLSLAVRSSSPRGRWTSARPGA